MKCFACNYEGRDWIRAGVWDADLAKHPVHKGKKPIIACPKCGTVRVALETPQISFGSSSSSTAQGG